VVGDAICSFNPVYGQGMSVAALQALNLRRHLERTGEPDPHRFFRDLARVIDVAWDIAVGGDLAFPGVEGRRTLKIRMLNAYLTRLLAAAADDAALAQAFIRVVGLVDRPEVLLHPRIILRVLRHRRLQESVGLSPRKRVARPASPRQRRQLLYSRCIDCPIERTDELTGYQGLRTRGRRLIAVGVLAFAGLAGLALILHFLWRVYTRGGGLI
jgi:hypothetical protein